MRGVRWLGATPRVVSFCSERQPGGNFRNSLLLTDARSRASVPFREIGVEPAPLLGLRASPSGRILLLVLKGAPSEIWAVRHMILHLNVAGSAAYGNMHRGFLH